MNEHDEKIDPDILKGREDILRARKAAASGQGSSNIEPDKPTVQSQPAGGPEKKPPRSILQEPSPIMKAVVDANRHKHTERGQSDIPVFDVSEKILVRQRQSSTAKRTAPPKIRTVEPAKGVRIIIKAGQVNYKKPDYNGLVAEIVARDIDRFCCR